MGKYNFIFEVPTKGKGKSEVIIYEKGTVYISRATVKKLALSGVKLRWGEDKANKILAFKKDEKGRVIREDKSTYLYCPVDVARRYAGRYNIEVEEDVYVLYPVEGARP